MTIKERFHFSFTPSLLPSEALEALFVQKEDLAERIVDLTRESVLGEAKYHFLLVGPRGIGKTHTVSLIYHRVKAIPEIRDRLLIAWLREDGWGIASFLDLLVQILQVLYRETNDEELHRRTDSLFELSPERAEDAAGLILKEYIGGRTLFLIVENLDELFAGLGEMGQKRLRAYLQENPSCTILATSPSLFNGVSLQTSPFYGFFSVHHLLEFDYDHAHDFLTKIARYKNDKHLTTFLRTPQGRARVRAVHHLAGGNPRVYTIFAQFLTRASMERLVEPFMRAMDDLTPYYQARMTLLSPQQRKIIELLCDRRGAVTVKEIAQRCFITHQTTSGQLKILREMRYVKSTNIGRESYYELSEPLMRISLEVKKSRGEPLRLFVEFLRCWYTRPELEGLLKLIPSEDKVDLQYVRQAINLSQDALQDPKTTSCRKEFLRHWENKKFDKAINILDELEALEGETYDNKLFRGLIFLEKEKSEYALEIFKQAIELDDKQSASWVSCGIAYGQLGLDRESVDAFDTAIELGEKTAPTWGLRGISLQKLGQHEEAVISFYNVLEIDQNDVEGWSRLGKSLIELQRFSEAFDAFSRVVELDSKNSSARIYQILSLAAAQQFKDAIALCVEYDLILSDNNGYTGIKALVYTAVDRDREALEFWQYLVNKGDSSSFVLFGKVGSLIGLKDWDGVTTTLDQALTLLLKEKGQDLGLTGQIISKLFSINQDRGAWRKGVDLLVTLYVKHKALFALASGLGGSIKNLLSPTVSNSNAEAWRDEWKSAAAGYPEMGLALRLLNTAVGYRKQKDPRILMDLPVEERKLLEDLIKEEEDAAGLTPTSARSPRSADQRKKQKGPKVSGFNPIHSGETTRVDL